MFITLGLCGHKMSHRTAGLLGTSGLFIITILSYIVAAQYFLQPRVDGIYPTITPYYFEWLRFTDWLHIDLGIMLDPISVMMLVVITTVSSMVHLYSLVICMAKWVSSVITLSFRFLHSLCWDWS